MTKRGRDQAKRSTPDAPETSTSQGMSFSGKYEERRYVSELPDPDDLAKLENLHPGTVELILEQYQEQARHRREMERKVIEGNVRQQNRGPVYGVIWLSALWGAALTSSLQAATGAVSQRSLPLWPPLSLCLSGAGSCNMWREEEKTSRFRLPEIVDRPKPLSFPSPEHLELAVGKQRLETPKPRQLPFIR